MNTMPRSLLARSSLLNPSCSLLSNTPFAINPNVSNQTRSLHSGRRTRKLLNLPPAPFFGGALDITGSSGRSRTSSIPAPPPNDHIIYNPPPSAPNIHHTPLKFLPPTDIRRRLAAYNPTATTPSPSNPTSTSTTPSSSIWPEHVPLPPGVFKTINPKKYHLTPVDFEEMRKLRKEDPSNWTLNRLADRFQCTNFFAGKVTAGIISEEYRKEAFAEHVANRKRWGVRRRKAKEERVRRREAWGRDE